MKNVTKDQQKAAREEKRQEKSRQTVENAKVPLYGNLRVEVKDEEVIRVLGVNMNSMSF